MTKSKKESQTKRDSERHCELLRYVTQENNLSVVCLYESIRELIIQWVMKYAQVPTSYI